MGGHVNVNLTEGCRCPARLAKLDTGNGVWLIAVANVMETQSGQNLLLEQGQKIADSINYAFDPDASTPLSMTNYGRGRRRGEPPLRGSRNGYSFSEQLQSAGGTWAFRKSATRL